MTNLGRKQLQMLTFMANDGPQFFDLRPFSPPWAQHLVERGLIERHSPKYWRITDAGRAAIESDLQMTKDDRI